MNKHPTYISVFKTIYRLMSKFKTDQRSKKIKNSKRLKMATSSIEKNSHAERIRRIESRAAYPQPKQRVANPPDRSGHPDFHSGVDVTRHDLFMQIGVPIPPDQLYTNSINQLKSKTLRQRFEMLKLGKFGSREEPKKVTRTSYNLLRQDEEDDAEEMKWDEMRACEEGKGKVNGEGKHEAVVKGVRVWPGGKEFT